MYEACTHGTLCDGSTGACLQLREWLRMQRVSGDTGLSAQLSPSCVLACCRRDPPR
jgi:hypothetical protein